MLSTNSSIRAVDDGSIRSQIVFLEFGLVWIFELVGYEPDIRVPYGSDALNYLLQNL